MVIDADNVSGPVVIRNLHTKDDTIVSYNTHFCFQSLVSIDFGHISETRYEGLGEETVLENDSYLLIGPKGINYTVLTVEIKNKTLLSLDVTTEGDETFSEGAEACDKT